MKLSLMRISLKSIQSRWRSQDVQYLLCSAWAGDHIHKAVKMISSRTACVIQQPDETSSPEVCERQTLGTSCCAHLFWTTTSIDDQANATLPASEHVSTIDSSAAPAPVDCTRSPQATFQHFKNPWSLRFRCRQPL